MCTICDILSVYEKIFGKTFHRILFTQSFFAFCGTFFLFCYCISFIGHATPFFVGYFGIKKYPFAPGFITEATLFGTGATNLISQVFQNLPSVQELKLVSVITLLAFLFGGLGFFEQLQNSFHIFWGITLKKKLGVRGYLKNQLFLVLAMVSCGGLFIASTLVEVIFSSISHLSAFSFLQTFLPVMGFFFGLFFMMMVFTFLYKFLTQANIDWKEALFGASITTVLFTLGKYITIQLLSHNATLSSYGVSSTIVIFLLFVYYSSQAIFIGAVATKIHAKKHGKKIRPNKNSVNTESVWNQLMGKV